MAGECTECERLFDQVEQRLGEISTLSKEAAAAIARRDHTLMEKLDSQLEHALGAKERSLGALRQHRREEHQR
jgi:hypothetical protein